MVVTAGLRRDRLHVALDRMRKKIAAACANEILARWHTRAQRLETEVDKLADEFSSEHPRLATVMINLFLRMAASDRMVHELNTLVPAGVATLRTAEMVARGVDRFTTAEPANHRPGRSLRSPRQGRVAGIQAGFQHHGAKPVFRFHRPQNRQTPQGSASVGLLQPSEAVIRPMSKATEAIEFEQRPRRFPARSTLAATLAIGGAVATGQSRSA